MNVAVCLAAATLVGKSFEQKSGAIGGLALHISYLMSRWER